MNEDQKPQDGAKFGKDNIIAVILLLGFMITVGLFIWQPWEGHESEKRIETLEALKVEANKVGEIKVWLSKQNSPGEIAIQQAELITAITAMNEVKKKAIDAGNDAAMCEAVISSEERAVESHAKARKQSRGW